MQGELGGGTSGKERGRGSYLGHRLPRRGGEGREQGESLKCFRVVSCVFCCKIQPHMHTYNPALFSSSLSPLSLMSAREGRKGETVMEGEKDLLLGRQQRWDTAKKGEGGRGRKEARREN